MESKLALHFPYISLALILMPAMFTSLEYEACKNFFSFS